MGATVGPVDTIKFASDLKGLWEKFNNLDQDAILASGGVGGGTGAGSPALDQKAEQEATGFLLDLVSVSGDNGLKLPRGELRYSGDPFPVMVVAAKRLMSTPLNNISLVHKN